MTKLQLLMVIVLALAAGIFGARLLFSLPSLATRSDDRASLSAQTGALAEKLSPLIAEHPGRSGLHALPDAEAAFAARIILARTARHTIDAQYYIWHKDLTGLLLLEALRNAADRGVNVRLLLDDNGISDLDPILAELDRHPNIAIRLYNPFTVRKFKHAGYLFDFPRLNRRMHNKSFTVDGLASIGGGRNIGDEYFGTGSQPAYVDLDLLATGAVVPDISNDFERYWNSASAYPFDLIVEERKATHSDLDAALAKVTGTPQLAAYKQKIAENQTVDRLATGELPLEWTTATLVSDPPGKTLGRAEENQFLIGQLDGLMGEIETSLDVISPYFVPGKRGTEHLTALVKRGVHVRILTNSLEATDVAFVHAGYAKYRRQLLEGGVELYELKANSAPGSKRSDAGFAGSSGASLHAKSFSVDGARIYIGSFNFDPRSVQLNTEMGLLVDSATMAQDMHRRFSEEIGSMAYVVSLDDQGNMQWREEREEEQPRIYLKDPHSSALKRGAVTAVGWLPIQWLL